MTHELYNSIYIYIYTHIYILLRGVENRRNIFFMYITNMFYLSLLFRTKNKIGKERRQAYPFSSRMICPVVHEAKGGREEKKIEDGEIWNCKSTHYLPISASLELSCPALRVNRETLFRHWQGDKVVAVLTSRRQHLSKSSVPIHPKCD